MSDNNSTSTTALPDPPGDAHDSWLPIYLTLVLTSVQCTLFLFIFEVNRRRDPKGIGGVYDRRRSVWPNRVPPPLMQNSSWQNWFFEWWRVRLSDPGYMEQARQEAVNTKIQQQEEELHANNKLPVEDTFLIQAEQTCWEESPFATPAPDEEEVDLTEVQLEQGTELNDKEPEEQDSARAVTTDAKTADTNGSDEAHDFVAATPPMPTRSALKQRASTAPSSLTQSGRGEAQSGRGEAPSFGDMARKIGLTDHSGGATDSCCNTPETSHFNSSERRVRFRDGLASLTHAAHGLTHRTKRSSTNFHGSVINGIEVPDVPYGSNLGRDKIRAIYDSGEERHPDWDVRTVQSLSNLIMKFFQKRVIKLRDSDVNQGNSSPGSVDDDGDEYDDEDDSEGDRDENKKKSKTHHVARKAIRRPLSAEDSELLRCIGLDSFMMLRFLKLGADTAFWPLVMACILLIPAYKVGGTAGQVGFYSATAINLVHGDSLHWLLVVYGFLSFSYILRRLWIEWEIFIPLRHDYLEKGDFILPRYQDQVQYA